MTGKKLLRELAPILIQFSMKVRDESVKKQIEYYKKKYEGSDINCENLSRSLDFFSNFYINRALRLLSFDYYKKKVLVVAGGGNGMEVKNLVELGSRVTVSDISPQALAIVKKNFPECKIVVADAQKLRFKNEEFDFAVVKDGLHHLNSPFKGIDEMLRVSSKGIVIQDFQEVFTTRLLRKLGITPAVEDAGNLNYHFDRIELTKRLESLRVKKWMIRSYVGHTSLINYKIFNNIIFYWLIIIVFKAINLFFSRWGNVMLVAIEK